MRRLLVFLILIFLVSPIITSAQNWQDRYVFTLQAATGDLTAAHTTGSVWVAPHIDIVIVLKVTKLTLPDGDDEVDFYFQTCYNQDANGDPDTWTDLENIHFDNADNGTTPTKIIRLGPWPPLSTGSKAADNTDGTLADDTKKDYPVGWLIRIKATVTGATPPTLAFSAQLFAR